MQKIAVASAITVPLLVLAALGLPEVSDWDELGRDFAVFIKKALHLIHACLGLVFVRELDPHVADHVITDVVSNDEVLDLTILCELHENFLIEILKVVNGVNQFLIRHVNPICFDHCSVWILVQVLKDDRLTDDGLVV